MTAVGASSVSTMGRMGGLFSNKAKVATYMGVLMPNLFVAPIRYFVMRETPEVRYRMFMRDALAAAAGVASFYLTRGASSALLKRTLMKGASAADRDLTATFMGWVVNVLVQGVGAVRMSEWMSKQQQAKAGTVSPKPEPALMPVSFKPATPKPVLPVMPPRPQFATPAMPVYTPVSNPFAISQSA